MLNRLIQGVTLCFIPVLTFAGCAPLPPLGPPPQEPAVVVESNAGVSSASMSKSPEVSSSDSSETYAHMEGLSLRQREFARQENEYFQRAVDDFPNWCGYNINAYIDWTTFPEQIDRRIDGPLLVSFFDYCDEGVEAISRMCQNQPGTREILQARIHNYVCHYGGPGQRSITLNGDTLILGVDWDATYYDRYIADYLGRVL